MIISINHFGTTTALHCMDVLFYLKGMMYGYYNIYKIYKLNL